MLEITDIQNEFITGSLLGDAHLTNLKYGRKSPSFSIQRKIADIDYLVWEYTFLNKLCSREIYKKDRYNKTTGKTIKQCGFDTRFLPCLLPFRQKWYPNGIKIVPQDIKLSKLIMQIWYCDDGSIEIISKNSFRIKLCTHGFLKEESEFLIELLKERYDEKFYLCKDGKHFFIRTNTKGSRAMLLDMKEGFPPMPRKLDLERIIL